MSTLLADVSYYCTMYYYTSPSETYGKSESSCYFGNNEDFFWIYRGVLRWDTSSLGTGVTVTNVELYRKFISEPSGASLYDLKYYIGNFGGDPFTADATSWNGGDLCYEESGASFTNGQWLTLAGGPDYINPNGYTTMRIRNVYNESVNANYLGTATYNVTTDPCILRVTYNATTDNDKFPFKA